MSDITLMLEAISAGDNHASEQLLPVVYDGLRRLAAARMSQAAAGHTLQPAALVHEAWLRLVGGQKQSWENRAHFFWRGGGWRFTLVASVGDDVRSL